MSRVRSQRLRPTARAVAPLDNGWSQYSVSNSAEGLRLERGQRRRGLMRQPVCHLRSDTEYIHQLESELTESTRRRAAFEERRLRLAEASGIHEPAILEALENLGYDHTSVALLFVVPLIQVAWADGSVSQIERDHIIAIAGLRGTKPNTPAYERLLALLDRQPPNEFFDGTLSAIEAVISAMPASERKGSTEALLLCCRDAAAVPCRLFGWMSRVCAAKRKVIEEIAKRLEPTQQVPG